MLRVVPAPSGAAPQWTGRAERFGRRVCEQILDLLKSDRVPEGLDETREAWLAHARGLLAQVPVSHAVRPLVRDARQTVWHTFAGTGINNVLARLVTQERLRGGGTSVSNLSQVDVELVRLALFADRAPADEQGRGSAPRGDARASRRRPGPPASMPPA